MNLTNLVNRGIVTVMASSVAILISLGYGIPGIPAQVGVQFGCEQWALIQGTQTESATLRFGRLRQASDLPGTGSKQRRPIQVVDSADRRDPSGIHS